PAKEKVRLIDLPDHDMEAGYEDFMTGLENKARYLLDRSGWIGFPIPDNGISTIAMRIQYQYA
ncbi:MAG: hypothetical protein GY866_38175, partial [Proteobacteria bacterium]|nr:hypothetical protein [Pseudomonadota bacterium]